MSKREEGQAEQRRGARLQPKRNRRRSAAAGAAAAAADAAFDCAGRMPVLPNVRAYPETLCGHAVAVGVTAAAAAAAAAAETVVEGPASAVTSPSTSSPAHQALERPGRATLLRWRRQQAA